MKFTLEEIVDALADQDETFISLYDPAYPKRQVGLNLAANPAMQARLLKSRRRAARALARLDGIHAPDAFLMAFADPILSYYKHWAFPGSTEVHFNYMFEFSPDTARNPGRRHRFSKMFPQITIQDNCNGDVPHSG